MSEKISFICTCGCEFVYSLGNPKVLTNKYCVGDDEYCDCGGYSYQADCPECGDSCEGEY